MNYLRYLLYVFNNFLVDYVFDTCPQSESLGWLVIIPIKVNLLSMSPNKTVLIQILM